LVESLNASCDLDDLEEQVTAAKEADLALQELNWPAYRSHQQQAQKLIAHPLREVISVTQNRLID